MSVSRVGVVGRAKASLGVGALIVLAALTGVSLPGSASADPADSPVGRNSGELTAVPALGANPFPPQGARDDLPGVGGTREDSRIPGHYIVVLKDSVDHPRAVAAQQTDKRGGDLGLVYSHAITGYSAELTKSAVESLRKSPNVRYVVPDRKVEALDQTTPTGIERAHATENEVADIDGEDTRVDVDVAVIDTGVDFEHPDLNVVSGTDCVPGASAGSLVAPRGVAVDPEGDVWVADTGNDRIQEFSSSGEYLSQFGSGGTGPGQFDVPSGVVIDPEGNVWVADTGNNRIQKFDPEGEWLLTLGSKGSGSGQFNTPWAVATDPEGNVYVADTFNHRIQKFDSDGDFLMTFGTESDLFPLEPKPGELYNPSGLAIDAEGNIWVADSFNNRIQVFDREGEFLFQFGKQGGGNGQFGRPRNISIDAAGNVWIADQEHFRMQKFNSKGEYLTQFGEVGSGPGQFGFIVGPIGVAASPEGGIFASDYENGRIQKWSSESPPSFLSAFGDGCIVGTAPDGVGHGTHVAGTIGAIDNGDGVVGIAPGARIWAVRVLNDNGEGRMSWIAAGIDWVVATREDEDPENDIEVANMSLGCACSGPDAKPVEDAISGYDEGEEHVPGAVDRGVVVVAAAGNSASDVAGFAPADNPDAITVSALADYDGKAGALAAPLAATPPSCEHGEAEEDWEHYGADDTMAKFSNWGEGVDIAAPGVCIYSTVPGGGYGYMSGTSMAAPHVAGAAALLASQDSPENKSDVEEIRDTLVADGSLDLRHTIKGPPAPLLYLDEDQLEGVEVATGGADEITSTSATIHGAVKTRGLATEYTLEYGTTTSYGKSVSGEIKAGESFARVSAALSNLSSDTTYHLRLKVQNSAGTFSGHDETFTTKRVTFTTGAMDVSKDGAALEGYVYLGEWPEGESTTYSFEYGTTTDYGQSIAAEIDESTRAEEVFGSAYDPIVKKVAGLSEATVYHYRAVATNNHGTFYGRDTTFRTASWTQWSGKEELPNSLERLSCVSASACMAINGGQAVWWDGKSWTNPTTPGGHLRDVSCATTTFCLAVSSKEAKFLPMAHIRFCHTHLHGMAANGANCPNLRSRLSRSPDGSTESPVCPPQTALLSADTTWWSNRSVAGIERNILQCIGMGKAGAKTPYRPIPRRYFSKGPCLMCHAFLRRTALRLGGERCIGTEKHGPMVQASRSGSRGSRVAPTLSAWASMRTENSRRFGMEKSGLLSRFP